MSLATLLLCACDPAGSSGSADSAATPTGERDAKATVKAGEGDAKAPTAGADATAPRTPSKAVNLVHKDAPKSLPKADAAALKETRKKLLAALNDGRKLVKDGKFDEGIAQLEAVLKIDSDHRAALAELGWAEFKAGRNDRAHAHTLRALSLAEEPSQRGMLQYNLGRIAEAREQQAVALAHYQQSLALRPNKTVQARHDELEKQLAASGEGEGGAAPTPAPGDEAHGPGLVVMKAGLADLDAVCEYARKESMCYGELCEKGASMASAPDFAMLEIGEQQLTCWHPAVRVGGTWTLFEHALMGQHGSEINEDVDDIWSRVVTGPAGQVMIYDFKEHSYERDWDFSELEELGDDALPGEDSVNDEGLIFCHAVGGAPACSQRVIKSWEFSSSDASTVRTYEAALEIKGDALVVSAVKASGITPARPGPTASAPYQLPEGEYPLASLSRPTR